MDILDCGDNSCRFAPKRGGMRTNGGCRCLRDLDHDPEQRMRVTKALLALRDVADAAAAFMRTEEGSDDEPRLGGALHEALKAAGR